MGPINDATTHTDDIVVCACVSGGLRQLDNTEMGKEVGNARKRGRGNSPLRRASPSVEESGAHHNRGEGMVSHSCVAVCLFNLATKDAGVSICLLF